MEVHRYEDLKNIQQELEFARELYAAYPQWLVMDVTFRGVEEVAARLMQLMAERTQDPKWSTGGSLLLGGGSLDV